MGPAGGGADLEVLTWDLAFSNMLHYIWPGLTGPCPRPTPERIALVHALQTAVASSYAGRALDARGVSLGNVAFTPEGTQVRFACRRLLGGQAVDRYELHCLHSQPRRHLCTAATAGP
ncbi:MAG: hypothetical protein AB2L07_09335 [Thermoanaerobaculaceae bacterium]